MSDEIPPTQPLVQGVRRLVYLLLGIVFTGLAIAGALLPVLPTTPFLLLASACFVRSSPSLNRRLLRSPLLGPFLRDWQKYRGVTLRVKIVAVVFLLLGVGASVWFGALPWPLVSLLLLLAVVGLVVVMRLPLIHKPPEV